MGNYICYDIMDASMHGDIESVEACLKRKEDPNQRDTLGRTLLIVASFLGHVDVVRFLIRAEARVDFCPGDFRGLNAYKLVLAATLNIQMNIECHIEEWRSKLRNEGAFYGWTSLFYASHQGRVDMVKLLVQNGAQIDAKDISNATALYWASKKGRLEVVQFLLEKGAKVDAMDFEGFTPLIVASENGHLNVVRSLLQKGANVEQVSKFDVTPLLAAIRGGSSDVVRALIKNGANVNKKRDDDNGLTPLHYCCLLGHSEIITVLLDGGANINALNNDGKSSLDLAIEKRNWTTSDTLLDRGAKFGNDVQNEELRKKVSKLNDQFKRFQDELKSVQIEKNEAVNEKVEEMAKLKKKHEGEISRLKKKNEGEISRLKKKNEGEISRLKKKHEGEISRLKKYEEKTARQKKDAVAIHDLLDRKNDEISFLKKKLNEMNEDNNRELEQTQLLKVANTTLSENVGKRNKTSHPYIHNIYNNSTVYNQKGNVTHVQKNLE